MSPIRFSHLQRNILLRMPNSSGLRRPFLSDDMEMLLFLETNPARWFPSYLIFQDENLLSEKDSAALQSTPARLHQQSLLFYPAVDEPLIFALLQQTTEKRPWVSDTLEKLIPNAWNQFSNRLFYVYGNRTNVFPSRPLQNWKITLQQFLQVFAKLCQDISLDPELIPKFLQIVYDFNNF